MKNLLFLSALFLFLDLPVYSQSTIDLKIKSDLEKFVPRIIEFLNKKKIPN